MREVADRLCLEFADPGRPRSSGGPSPASAVEPLTAGLAAEDEALIEALRGALARIATATAKDADDLSSQTIEFVLDGAEFVVRGELAADKRERVLELLPSLVYLVVLPGSDRDRALEISRRAAELLG
jgi:hypothetical protein